MLQYPCLLTYNLCKFIPIFYLVIFFLMIEGVLYVSAYCVSCIILKNFFVQWLYPFFVAIVKIYYIFSQPFAWLFKFYFVFIYWQIFFPFFTSFRFLFILLPFSKTFSTILNKKSIGGKHPHTVPDFNENASEVSLLRMQDFSRIVFIRLKSSLLLLVC